MFVVSNCTPCPRMLYFLIYVKPLVIKIHVTVASEITEIMDIILISKYFFIRKSIKFIENKLTHRLQYNYFTILIADIIMKWKIRYYDVQITHPTLVGRDKTFCRRAVMA